MELKRCATPFHFCVRSEAEVGCFSFILEFMNADKGDSSPEPTCIDTYIAFSHVKSYLPQWQRSLAHVLIGTCKIEVNEDPLWFLCGCWTHMGLVNWGDSVDIIN